MSSTQKTALVIVDVFIGNDRLIGIKKENYWVRSIDLKHPELSTSEEMVTIKKQVEYVSKIAIKKVDPKHMLATPLGVRGRNSDNRLIERELKWKPKWTLVDGLQETYTWIKDQVRAPV